MATVRDLLRGKGNEIWSISPDTTMLDTLKFLADKDVGALLVMEQGRMVGIISERDFVRAIAKTEQVLLYSTAKNYMTKEIFTIDLDHSIEDCMKLMTEKRIRHLPVMDDGKLVGLISIGDVVKEIISSKESTINALENYIQGSGYAH
jgi:CBS domain-containing protein